MTARTLTKWSRPLRTALGRYDKPAVGQTLFVRVSEEWKPYLLEYTQRLEGSEKAEELIRRVTIQIAAKFEPIFHATKKAQG
jgi:hypothetical protein